jgi:hypothetical protein
MVQVTIADKHVVGRDLCEATDEVKDEDGKPLDGFIRCPKASSKFLYIDGEKDGEYCDEHALQMKEDFEHEAE